MKTSAPNLAKSFQAETLRCLGDGVDTQKADDFLDQVFELAAMLGTVTCTLTTDGELRVQAQNILQQHVKISRGKTKVRMLCARLAVRCGEWANRKIAPYGDVVDVEMPPKNQLFRVRFVNTTETQEFSVESGLPHSDSGTS